MPSIPDLTLVCTGSDLYIAEVLVIPLGLQSR